MIAPPPLHSLECTTYAHTPRQTLAGDVDQRQLQRMCKIYAKNEREAALEHLLAASKGMTNIDRLKVYEILLDAYRLSKWMNKLLKL